MVFRGLFLSGQWLSLPGKGTVVYWLEKLPKTPSKKISFSKKFNMSYICNGIDVLHEEDHLLLIMFSVMLLDKAINSVWNYVLVVYIDGSRAVVV